MQGSLWLASLGVHLETLCGGGVWVSVSEREVETCLCWVVLQGSSFWQNDRQRGAVCTSLLPGREGRLWLEE